MLWNGRIDAIRKKVSEIAKGKRLKKSLLKILDEYFGEIQKFQYDTFRKSGIPTGSGTVESAIRRVINLRIKSPGIFWKRKNANRMIFLRSQVLSGRWKNVFGKALDANRKMLLGEELELEGVAA